MNIFVTSSNPVKAARYLDDQRVVKMMTETIQMLCVAVDHMGKLRSGMYATTHANHPCNVWTRERRGNYEWMYEHALALQDEWRTRWGHDKRQKAIAMFEHYKGWRYAKYLPKGSSPFVNCAANESLGLNFKHIEDVRQAYKLYLKARWKLQQKGYPRQRLPVCSVRF